MKKLFIDNWKFLLFVLIGGLVGGYFAGLYFYDSLTEEMLINLQTQNVSKDLLVVVSMIQYGIFYGLILAIIGIFISKKVNLWKKVEINKKSIITVSIITIIGALVLFPGDKLIFGSFSNWVNEQYISSPTIEKIIAGLLAGGIIEEVMMRLFFMSLLVLIISKVFYKNKKDIPVRVYIIANIISSFLFAIGHLPATMQMTNLNFVILFRCILFNGGIGLCFGYLYRKYDIRYAVVSHGLMHLISDTLMLIFL